MYKKYIKRIIDIVLSLIFILVLSPVYLLIAILVRVMMGRPILFSQERIGYEGKTFTLRKFRSMTDQKDSKGNLLDEQLRLTKFGIAIRTSSLDELPELFAILKGDMSFVGPRPLPIYYEPYFFPEEKIRHEVKGGLIPVDGLSGEIIPTWETQFQYDKYYVENISFLLDCKIVFATILILFRRVKSNYGAEDRPHLNEYRAWMNDIRGKI